MNRRITRGVETAARRLALMTRTWTAAVAVAAAAFFIQAARGAEDSFALRRAAEGGNADAALELGRRHLAGRDGASHDLVEALRWYRQAAEAGNAQAQLYMGIALWHGEGTAADRDASRTWLTKAVSAGSLEAQMGLGFLLLTDKQATGSDRLTGYRSIKLAAQRGHAGAQAAVALASLMGQGGEPPNPADAYVWASLASKGTLKFSPELQMRNPNTAEIRQGLTECLERAKASLSAQAVAECDARVAAFKPRSDRDVRASAAVTKVDIVPSRVTAGGNFDLVVTYTAIDPKVVLDSFDVTLTYRILRDGKCVYTGTPVAVRSRNGLETRKVLKNLRAGRRPGIYRMEAGVTFGNGVTATPRPAEFVIE